MTNLSVNTADQFKAFILEHLQGNKNLSIRGVAKMAGVDESAIRRSADFSESKLSKKLATQGFKSADFSESGIPSLAAMLILEYYSFEANRKTELALTFYRACATYGLQKVIEECTQVEEIKPISLPPANIQLKELADSLEVLKSYGVDMSNPRFTQALTDTAANIIMPKVLPPSTSGEKWLGAIEIIEQYTSVEPPSYNHLQSWRVKLGRFMSTKMKEYGNELPIKEKRIVNGRETEVKLYKITSDMKNFLEDLGNEFQEEWNNHKAKKGWN